MDTATRSFTPCTRPHGLAFAVVARAKGQAPEQTWRCGHGYWRRQRLAARTVGGEDHVIADVIDHPFAVTEDCIVCRESAGLATSIVCVNCGAPIVPGDQVVIYEDLEIAESPRLKLGTKTQDGLGYVGCRTRGCFVNDRTAGGIWTGEGIQLPSLEDLVRAAMQQSGGATVTIIL